MKLYINKNNRGGLHLLDQIHPLGTPEGRR